MKRPHYWYLFLTGMLFLQNACNYDGTVGNGRVTEENRHLRDFNAIRAGSGVNVFISQGPSESVTARADENLIENLVTEVKDSVLWISSRRGVRRPTAWEVEVQAKTLNSIHSGSGSDVESRGMIRAGGLTLNASSGSDMVLELKADTVHCEAGSGSDVRLQGEANGLYIQAASGSDVNAGKLVTAFCEASASGGSDIQLHVTGHLKAHASSGADIRYAGSPEQVDKEESSGGDINAVD